MEDDEERRRLAGCSVTRTELLLELLQKVLQRRAHRRIIGGDGEARGAGAFALLARRWSRRRSGRRAAGAAGTTPSPRSLREGLGKDLLELGSLVLGQGPASTCSAIRLSILALASSGLGGAVRVEENEPRSAFIA